MVEESRRTDRDATECAVPLSPLRRPASWTAVALVRAYQRWISPSLGNNCRFYPTCSEYYILAVQRYGFVWGTLKGLGRIFRCHPFHPGGVDYP